MALTRKFLTALGIEAEKIDQIIENHSETVDALKDEIKGLKEKAANADEIQKELDEAKKSLEGKDGYEDKYKALKAEYDQYKADVTAKAESETKSRLYRDLLKKAGVSDKRLDAILKVTALADLKLSKDGATLEDSDKLTEGIKKEWADFIGKQEQKGADTATPPEGGTPAPQKSRAAELYKQHYAALYGEQKGNEK